MSVAVNSYNEWSPLKEVIVGSAYNYTLPPIDQSFKLFYHDLIHPNYPLETRRVIKQQYIEELEEDITGLVATFEQLGVKVHRPTQLPEACTIRTPYWESTALAALNVRDQAIIAGNEIIETAPMLRARYFENDLLKPIFYDYFKAGSMWTLMPKPMMLEKSFDLSYVEHPEEYIKNAYNADNIPRDYPQPSSPYDIGYEMLFDGAQCMRFGEDWIVDVSNQNHELGFQWLQRHFEGKIRVHKLDKITDNHIDTTVIPLRPGTLLMRSPNDVKKLPAALQKWDIIYVPQPSMKNFPNYEKDDLVLSSNLIDANVFSVDGDKLIVNSLYPELIKLLEQHKFTPIPVQHRHRQLVSGGFHCFTLDTVREGGLERYF
ncbi:glycine amidinotransferase [Ectothiorhodospiraceae bacterium BW-2]|nr:glycine amidinotransferase [Ectothiorhodospiraceae bacterium BW-2]